MQGVKKKIYSFEKNNNKRKEGIPCDQLNYHKYSSSEFLRICSAHQIDLHRKPALKRGVIIRIKIKNDPRQRPL